MKKNNNTKGFSLIELSIVLIIIGLLIAGITGGASLIRSAELRSTISEIRNYQTAVNAFYTEKGYLPGTIQGSSNQMSLLYSGTAWDELYEAKITDFDSAPTSAGFTSGSTNSPAGRMKGSNYLLGYVGTAVNVVNANSLILTGIGTETTGTAPGSLTGLVAALKPSIAKQIDEKMDDGKPATGKILALGATPAATACQSTSVATTAIYNNDVTTNQCGLIIKLGV